MMTPTATVFYAVSMFGLTYIVGHSIVTMTIRSIIFGNGQDIGPVRFARETFIQLLECPACFGFWTGVAMSTIGAIPFEVPYFNILAWGLFTAGSNFILAKITRLTD